MLLVIMGETGSGKDTIVEKLTEDEGYKKVVTYTTRPKRQLEVNHVDYHFVNEKEFKQLQDKKKLISHDVYNDWHYGFSLDGIDFKNEKYVIILTPIEFERLRKKIGEKNVQSVFLDVHERERLIRLANRGDNVDELMRRIKSDRADFKDFKAVANSIVDVVIKEDNFNRMYRKLKHFIKGSDAVDETTTEW